MSAAPERKVLTRNRTLRSAARAGKAISTIASGNGKVTTRRMNGEKRRQQIADVAAELFSKRGFSGTTTREIADRAGVSEAIIFRHFATKDDLYAAILDQKVRVAVGRVQEHLKEAAARKDDKAFFGSLAVELLEFHRADRSFMRLLLFSALEGHDLSRIFFNSTVVRLRQTLIRYIKQRIGDGAYRKIDPAVASRAFIGMLMHQVQIQNIFGTDQLKLSNRSIADRFVKLFLSGLQESDSRGTVRRSTN
jgi:AcrR family transcriptional regulator